MLRTLDLRGTGQEGLIDLPRPDLGGQGPVEDVRAILVDVAKRGDLAVREYTSRFDGVELESLAVDREERTRALSQIPSELRAALVEAHDAIFDFHSHRSLLVEPYVRDGVKVELLELPVARAGLYAPGGLARYPSSVLMTAVPARVAGVSEIVCCIPPGPSGALPDEILAAAEIAGVDEVYRVGGAQAIAAMAYGTESIGKVDVIVGPGSKWVSIAQREVRGTVGVPAGFAGPSEVVVIADATTPIEWAAIDVIVQAEHGPDGLAWLVTWDERVANDINVAIQRLLAHSSRRDETESTLRSGGYAVLVDSPAHAIMVANAIAPEHLEILTADARDQLRLVRNAGAVFLGPYSPASFGDYMAGPSHVLPTFGTARFASVLGVEDFIRRVHAISVDEAGAKSIARHVATIAQAEGLPAHGESALMRIDESGWTTEPT